MRQPSNSGRRSRGRPNRKPHGGNPGRSTSLESNGPEGRIRGNASQVYEKYISLARDAASSGDRVAAETYYQHAEHYYRIFNDSTDPQSGNRHAQGGENFHRHRNGRDHQRDGNRDAAPDGAQPDRAHDAVQKDGPKRDEAASDAAVADPGSQVQPSIDQAPSNSHGGNASGANPPKDVEVTGEASATPSEAKPPRLSRGRPRKKAQASDGQPGGDGPVEKPRRGRRKAEAVEAASGAGEQPSDGSGQGSDDRSAPPPSEAVNS